MIDFNKNKPFVIISPVLIIFLQNGSKGAVYIVSISGGTMYHSKITSETLFDPLITFSYNTNTSTFTLSTTSESNIRLFSLYY